LPKPTIPESAAELPEPAPPPPLLDLTPSQPAKPKQPVSMRAPPKHYRSTRDTEFDGPPATRNEYLAYCEALIVRHRGVVSDSFLAGRQGSLTLTLLVLGDGTISRITVARSSGYQDIDSRVEQMVSAVGRFPPLPQWFQGQAMPLMYHFAFPVRR
jgi:TonB family protein